MHDTFATIEFGPFSTDYHRDAVNQTFKEHLSSFLVKEVLPQIAAPFDRTSGQVKARYNDERYAREGSRVRNIYSFEFRVHRGERYDLLKTEFIYDSATADFKPRTPNDTFVLFTLRHGEIGKEIEALWERVAGGERLDAKCPQCGDELFIRNNEMQCHFQCQSACFVFTYVRDPETGGFRHGRQYFFKKPLHLGPERLREQKALR